MGRTDPAGPGRPRPAPRSGHPPDVHRRPVGRHAGRPQERLSPRAPVAAPGSGGVRGDLGPTRSAGATDRRREPLVGPPRAGRAHDGHVDAPPRPHPGGAGHAGAAGRKRLRVRPGRRFGAPPSHLRAVRPGAQPDDPHPWWRRGRSLRGWLTAAEPAPRRVLGPRGGGPRVSGARHHAVPRPGRGAGRGSHGHRTAGDRHGAARTRRTNRLRPTAARLARSADSADPDGLDHQVPGHLRRAVLAGRGLQRAGRGRRPGRPRDLRQLAP